MKLVTEMREGKKVYCFQIFIEAVNHCNNWSKWRPLLLGKSVVLSFLLKQYVTAETEYHFLLGRFTVRILCVYCNELLLE